MRLTGASSFLPVIVRGTAGTATIASGTWRGESSERSAPAIRARSSSSSSRSPASATKRISSPAPPSSSSRCTTRLSATSGELLDHGVELARAHAHAAAVERRVGAPGDDAAAALGEEDPVALAPDAGVDVEVGGAVALVARVVPQAHRHRGHRLGDHHLAQLAHDHVAVGVEGLDVGAQAAAGDLAVVDRLQEAARDEGAADVGAAAAVEAQDVGTELLVDVVVALARQRRAGEAERADAREVVVAAELQARLAAGHEEGRADAHEASAASPRPAATGTTGRATSGRRRSSRSMRARAARRRARSTSSTRWSRTTAAARRA